MKNVIYCLTFIASLLALTTKGQEAPPNDLCDNAIPIKVGNAINGRSLGATSDAAIAPFCHANVVGNGVWYKFVGTGERITLSTCTASTF